MKYVKMLSLAAVAAMALMAFVASSASATTLDGPGGTALPAKTAIDASLTGSETAKLEAGSTVLDECSGGTVEGVTSNETGTTVNGTVATKDLTWSGCSKTTTTLAGGELSIASNGSVSGTGFEVTVNSIFGSCTYGLGTGKTLGTLVSGTPATLAINAKVSKVAGGGLCPAEPTWTANYTVTSPTTLTVTK